MRLRKGKKNEHRGEGFIGTAVTHPQGILGTLLQLQEDYKTFQLWYIISCDAATSSQPQKTS